MLKPPKPMDLPPDDEDGGFGFYRPDELSYTLRGYVIWEASGFVRMPSREEILAIDEWWHHDLNKIREVFQYVRDTEQATKVAQVFGRA